MADAERLALLEAIAQAGTRGKEAYQAAQAQIAQQQQEAVRMALSSSVAGDAPAEAQAELSRIIGEPYQSRSAYLTSNQVAQEDWFNRLGASQNAYQTNINRLADIMAANAAAGGGGGGGSGGSGRAPKEEEPPMWDDLLRDQFSSVPLGLDAIGAEANRLGLTKFKTAGKAPWLATQDYAIDKYGVPAGIAASHYTQPADDKEFINLIPDQLELARKAGKTPRQFMNEVRATAKSIPGNQKYITTPVKKTAKQTLSKNKKKK